MAGLNPTLNRSAGRRISSAALTAPRLVMSWEDWLTLGAALIVFLSLAFSIQQAEWVERMPPIIPTVMLGLLIGLFAARIKYTGFVIQPIAILLGLGVVAMAAQSYADGVTVSERLADFRVRMNEWFNVVRAGDISNDNLPFVTLVHGVSWLAAYLGAWSIYRWHNGWVAIVPGGIVLLANISFLKGQPSGAFLFFAFGSILLISRLHIQKNQARWKRQGVEYPDWMSLNALNFTFLLAVALIVGAWTIPLGTQAAAAEAVFDKLVSPATNKSENLVRLFHNIDSRKGAQLHTFGATLPIQGNVKLGTKQLFEVSAGQGGLIRATSYDEYTGAGWKATDRDTSRIGAQQVADTPDVTGEYKERIPAILRVKVLDSESTILMPGIPVGTNVATLVDTPKGFAGDIERLRSRRALGKDDTYNSIGSESRATAEQLEAAGSAYPDWVTGRYLQLPNDLPARVAEEAKKVTAAGTNPYDKSILLQDYLRSFPYDLAVESAPAGRDSVDFLLFDLKRGYFDYQATAMTVMLRTLGIPARITVGYILDPEEVEETRYLVRKDDAYSWVEVFFPGYGWVNFNPTQDRPAGGAGGVSTIDPSDATDIEALTLEELFDPSLFDEGDTSGVSTALSETPVDAREVPWTLIWTLVGVLLTAAALVFAGRLGWNWGMSSLDERSRLWAKTNRLASWGGLGSKPAETPREWSRRMGAVVHQEEEAVSLARAYEETRYGRPDLQRMDDAEASSAYLKLRKALAGFVINRGRRSSRKDRKTS